jgi:hypothetical protein
MTNPVSQVNEFLTVRAQLEGDGHGFLALRDQCTAPIFYDIFLVARIVVRSASSWVLPSCRRGVLPCCCLAVALLLPWWVASHQSSVVLWCGWSLKFVLCIFGLSGIDIVLGRVAWALLSWLVLEMPCGHSSGRAVLLPMHHSTCIPGA